MSPAPERTAPRAHLVPVLAVALVAATVWAALASYGLLAQEAALARLLARQRSTEVAHAPIPGTAQGATYAARTPAQGRRDGADPLPDELDERLAILSERQDRLERRQDRLSDLARPGPPPSAAPGGAADGGGWGTLRLRGEDRSEVLDPQPIDPGPVGPRASRGLRNGADRILADLEQRLDRLGELQARGLDRLGARARRDAGRLRAAIRRTGLDPARFEGSDPDVGGPFVPLDPGAAARLGADPFEAALSDARRALEDGRRLARAAAALPFGRPLAGESAVSSGFGTRLDPFTRGLALHTGLDLRAGHGTPARATASGRVVTADVAGGYGIMVEVDHGHGLVTRYAHLADVSVAPGQRVAAGTVLGHVGSTGRSTGSHLHYETRLDGEPIDPLRFLDAGEDLAQGAGAPDFEGEPAGDPDDDPSSGLSSGPWQAWIDRQSARLARRRPRPGYSMSSTASAPP